MFTEKKHENGFVFRAYQGDAKTLLCFDLPKALTRQFAGFTIHCKPPGKKGYYLYNKLVFEHPEQHAVVASEPLYSTINAPIQKFRWVHVPGVFHQTETVAFGRYVYTVTPRYFDAQRRLEPLRREVSVSLTVPVSPFRKGKLSLGFTRGFVQSQGFKNLFGTKARFKPAKKALVFDTSGVAGSRADGRSYRFVDVYRWSGFTAREKIMTLLQEVVDTPGLTLDVMAYDLNEPDVIRMFLTLAEQGRLRILLDNAALHSGGEHKTPEDEFERQVTKVAQSNEVIKRGHFGRYQHNKVLLVRSGGKAVKVLTGSTNFSVTGLYVNANHVAQFDDREIAGLYGRMFEEAWTGGASKRRFEKTALATEAFSFDAKGLGGLDIRFSPHTLADAEAVLTAIAQRIEKEQSTVLFAVMDTSRKSTGPVAPMLIEVHKRTGVFSAGITDSDNELCLYKPSSAEGLRVTGKPKKPDLPPPFDKEAGIGLGHQIHHKFVVCGFNRNDAVVWLGSSNLALGGEQQNGDNLIEIRDPDIATAFAIEAIALVDHFHFRDNHSESTPHPSDPVRHLHLYVTAAWLDRYYEPGNIYYKDRRVFIGT